MNNHNQLSAMAEAAERDLQSQKASQARHCARLSLDAVRVRSRDMHAVRANLHDTGHEPFSRADYRRQAARNRLEQ